MTVEIQITRDRINLSWALPAVLAGRAGAIVEFQGVVRGTEDGRPIAALEYEAYASMAEKLMSQIARELMERNRCLFFRAIHRVGIVPEGEAAIHLVAAGTHRAEAFGMISEFMDRLKQDVPIWKRRALSEGELAL